MNKFRFGFYRCIEQEKILQCFELCRQFNIKKFDTAQLYRNENACAKYINPNIESIGTKIYHVTSINKLQMRIKQSINKFQNMQLDYILLHKIMPIPFWEELVKWYQNNGSISCKTIGHIFLAFKESYKKSGNTSPRLKWQC